MKRSLWKKTYLLFFILGVLILGQGIPSAGMGGESLDVSLRKEQVLEWRKERDDFFKNHVRSPLISKEKKNFKGLHYYPFDPQYVFFGQIERFIFHIENPKYYATFLTNKGTNKHIFEGKFHYNLNGKEYVVEITTILSDNLFIPLRTLTNGKETYGEEEYIDAKSSGYKMVWTSTWPITLPVPTKNYLCSPSEREYARHPHQSGGKNFK
jgi:hypothetical protein